MNDLSPRQCPLPRLLDWGGVLTGQAPLTGGRLLPLGAFPASLADGLTPVGLLQPLQPRDEDGEPIPVTDLAAGYAEQAFELHRAGALALLLYGCTDVRSARAAVLGSRQTGLPVLICVQADSDGDTPEQADFSAVLASVQHLGAAAVGFACSGDRIDTLTLLGQNAPFAAVPLFCRLQADRATARPEELNAFAEQALRAGGDCFLLGEDITEEQAFAIARALNDYDPDSRVTEPDTETLFMSCETEAFYLTDDNLLFSEPIRCQYDMAADILAAEELGCDVLNFHVETLEDAENFAANAHMIRMPICITAHDEVALELALMEYNGRAFVDISSEVSHADLHALARGYGAVIL